MEPLKLFLKGVQDSLRIGTAIKEILGSFELTKRTVQCMVINGFIYLGSVVLYNIFISSFFTDSEDSVTKNIIVQVLRLIMNVIYNGWIFMIYIVSMTLTTYWAQDIFDELIVTKLQRHLNAKSPIKNPGQHLKEIQRLDPKLSAKERGIDLIQRTFIITLYLVLTSLITYVVRSSLGKFFGAIIEIFFYSVLNAYYCYEYKTSAMEMDVMTSIELFES